jgi:hypothetical protein
MKRTKPLISKTPIRKVSKKKRAYRASAEGQAGMDHMARVKMLPCVICQAPPPNDAHHCYHDRYGTRKQSDLDTIPLCKWCHQDGPQSVHRDKAGWKDRHGPDYGFLDRVKQLLDPRPEWG